MTKAGMTKEDAERFERIANMKEGEASPEDEAWARRQNPITWLAGVAEGNYPWDEAVGMGALITIGRDALVDEGFPGPLAEIIAASSILDLKITGCRYEGGAEEEAPLEFCIDGEWKRIGS